MVVMVWRTMVVVMVVRWVRVSVRRNIRVLRIEWGRAGRKRHLFIAFMVMMVASRVSNGSGDYVLMVLTDGHGRGDDGDAQGGYVYCALHRVTQRACPGHLHFPCRMRSLHL